MMLLNGLVLGLSDGRATPAPSGGAQHGGAI